MNITRRAALKGTAAVAAVAAVPTAASTVTLASDDPLITAAAEIRRVSKMWLAADEAFEKAADEAGYHSHQLELDFDMVLVKTKDLEAAWSRHEIEAAAERGDLTPKQRDRFLAKVDAMQDQAAQIRRETGLEPVAQEVAANRTRYWELRKEICKTPANSIKGVLAKFRGFYHEDEVEQMIAGDNPWDDLDAEYAGSVPRGDSSLAGLARGQTHCHP